MNKIKAWVNGKLIDIDCIDHINGTGCVSLGLDGYGNPDLEDVSEHLFRHTELVDFKFHDIYEGHILRLGEEDPIEVIVEYKDGGFKIQVDQYHLVQLSQKYLYETEAVIIGHMMDDY